MLPEAPKIQPGAIVSRPWGILVPAAIYVAATIGYGWRLRRANSALDRALFIAAGLNVICHVTISESQQVFDAAFTVAHLLMVLSYVVVPGRDPDRQFPAFRSGQQARRLWRLFDRPRQPSANAGSDRERNRALAGATHRSFAVLMFGDPGPALKKVNDRFGHLVGSQAIKRLGDVLRSNCRAIDTAARYGGDEFAVVLAESGQDEAEQVAGRICELLPNDGLTPRITVSVGVAVYPTNGTTIEELLEAADVGLYEMKRRNKRPFHLSHVAACL